MLYGQQCKEKTTEIGKVLSIACFMTVISQLPQFVGLGISSLMSQAIWMLFFVIVVYYKRDLVFIKPFMFSVAFLIIYMVFVVGASLISGKNYYQTSLFSVIILSVFVLFLGTQIGEDLTVKDLTSCGKAYVLASVILAIDLYLFVYRGSDISDRTYQYASKNSAGVILMTAAIIAILADWKNLKKIEIIINIACLAVFLVMIFIMKTRAMIVCIPVVITLLFWKAPFGNKFRLSIIIACVASIFALQNEKIYDIVINQILFVGRKNNLDDISSGRFNQWQNFDKYMAGNWFIGDGHTELESLILTAFVQCGVLIGTLIILYAFWPVLFAMVKIFQKENSREMFLLFLIAVVYFIDAIFEQLAPFGPGARCFYLWLIFGVVLSRGKVKVNGTLKK